jgi:HEPN domain-containing protein
MSARSRITAFLQLADEELRAARLLSVEAPRQAAYLCQQCAEKIARAVLTHAGVPFGTGHNLGQMASALPDSHPWRERLAALDKHSPAATRFRYPSPTGRIFDPPAAERLSADIAELAALLADSRADLGREDG